MSWRVARSSRPGTAHVENGVPCQDRSVVRIIPSGGEDQVFVAIVSDGAGSAALSHVGAGLICEAGIGEVQGFMDRGGRLADVTRTTVEEWLSRIVDSIETHAECHDLKPRDLAGTCLGCVVGPDASVCFQVGDGAIVLDDPEADFSPVFWPQRGEYANTTTFIHERDSIATADFRLIERSVERVAVFSDGIQMLALHYASQKAHAPFFAALFATLEMQAPGESEALNGALDEFLDRKVITDRTDDDRTLVLGSRRPGPGRTSGA